MAVVFFIINCLAAWMLGTVFCFILFAIHRTFDGRRFEIFAVLRPCVPFFLGVVGLCILGFLPITWAEGDVAGDWPYRLLWIIALAVIVLLAITLFTALRGLLSHVDRPKVWMLGLSVSVMTFFVLNLKIVAAFTQVRS